MLEADFRNTVQGDLSVLSYSQRLKALADALADVGQPVSSDTLVLTLLRCLNDNLRHMVAIIKTRSPLLSFLEAHSLLTLKEADLQVRKSTTAMALMAPSTSKATTHSSSSSPFGTPY
ncbi:uncharacterized protein LOC133903504 [Phragmites australis]|uniref:uncharacterized protein LOC133903504 n=1 Tax=Phragmites australis TaxID=29695 RepID=UPI002D7A10D8|nr:uncharacterized protein LOC133903504 [Phragmites australis]